jgi:hypothetical protein
VFFLEDETSGVNKDASLILGWIIKPNGQRCKIFNETIYFLMFSEPFIPVQIWRNTKFASEAGIV